MQIIQLPKNIRKAYDYAMKHQLFHEFREEHEARLCEWSRLRKKYKMSFKDLSKQFGFSRATYYRRRCILRDLNEGKAPPSKPRRPKMRTWGAAEAC